MEVFSTEEMMQDHQEEMEKHNINKIDLIIINLYKFLEDNTEY